MNGIHTKGELHVKEKRLNTESDFIQEFNAISVGVVVIDANGRVDRVNEPLLNYFNRNSEDFIGKQFGDAGSMPGSRLNKLGCGFDPSCEFCEVKCFSRCWNQKMFR